MVSLTALLIVAAIFAIFYYMFKKESYPGKLPPGPKGLPWIGNTLSITWRPYIKFGEWVDTYGPVYRVNIAGYKFVIISDAKIAREAYNDVALTGRPDFRLFNILTGPHGIVNSQGKEWVEQRRFTLRTLRDYGFAKTTQQELAAEEVQDLINLFKSKEGSSITLNRTFDLATVNSLWTIMTSKRFALDDPVLNHFIQETNEMFENVSGNPLPVFFPNFCEKFPRLTGWGKLMEALGQFETLITEPVRKAKADYDVKDPPQDFVEAYIQEVSNTTDPESTFYKSLGERNRDFVVLDLFGAGSGTTSATLQWAILYLCKYPEIQRKLHEEIDRVVGQSRQPKLDDRKNMPYTEAFTFETLRRSSIVPFGVFHEAMETTTVAGYTIPKGTWIAVNQYFVHHNPKVWNDPESFRPERFLSADGKTVVKNESLIPFSVGRRVCIGEQIAKDGFFLFITGLVQRFQFQFDPKAEVPTEDGTNPMFRVTPPFSVVVKDRMA